MPRKPGGVRSPTRLEREYIALLTRRILAPLFIDLQARVVGATSAAEVDRAVEEATAAAEARGVPVESVRAQLNRLSAYHRARVIQTMISALGVDVGPMLTEPAVNAFMTRVVERNVDLIKTIPPRFHDSMKDRLSAELRDQPFDRQRLTQLLAREYGSTGYNLRRLARDQTTKTIGGLTEIRQRQLGIQGYRWSSSADERVRQTHVANNGRMFRWDSPPAATGHPGTAILCRCVAIPAVLKADRARLGAKPAPTRRKPRKDTPASRRRRVETIGKGFRRDPIVRQRDEMRAASQQADASVRAAYKKYDALPFGDPGRNAARAEWSRTTDVYYAAIHRLRVADVAAGVVERKYRKDVLGVLRPDGVQMKPTGAIKVPKKGALKDTTIAPVVDDVQAFVSPKLPIEHEVRFRKGGGGRGWAKPPFGGDPGVVSIEVNQNAATIFHEVVHHVDFSHPDLRRDALAFWKKRRKGAEPILRLKDMTGRGFRPDERAIEDEWRRATKGIWEHYPDGTPYPGYVDATDTGGAVIAPEVVTMGMEAMWRDAARFAKNDPEYFDWIVANVMRRGLD